MYWENNRILDQIDLTKCESQLHLHSAMAVESSITPSSSMFFSCNMTIMICHEVSPGMLENISIYLACISTWYKLAKVSSLRKN